MGGVVTGGDVLQFLAAGASAIALGTVLFSDPDAPARIRAELAVELAALGVAEPDDAVGLAHDGASTLKDRSSVVGQKRLHIGANARV
jgi:dihydroorotate dehydrogenase (NAD+) catalytic subunit